MLKVVQLGFAGRALKKFMDGYGWMDGWINIFSATFAHVCSRAVKLRKSENCGLQAKTCRLLPTFGENAKIRVFFAVLRGQSVETYCYLRTQNVTSKSAEGS